MSKYRGGSKLTGINLWLESFLHNIEAASDCLWTHTILGDFIFVWHKVRQVNFTFWHCHESAHIWSKFILECSKVDESITISIKYVLHQETNILLRCLDFILLQVCLEVFIGHKTISIDIEPSEDLKGSWLSTAEAWVLNVSQNLSQSASSDLIWDLTSSCLCQLLVHKHWWWVSPHLVSQGKS